MVKVIQIGSIVLFFQACVSALFDPNLVWSSDLDISKNDSAFAMVDLALPKYLAKGDSVNPDLYGPFSLGISDIDETPQFFYRVTEDGISRVLGSFALINNAGNIVYRDTLNRSLGSSVSGSGVPMSVFWLRKDHVVPNEPLKAIVKVSSYNDSLRNDYPVLRFRLVQGGGK